MEDAQVYNVELTAYGMKYLVSCHESIAQATGVRLGIENPETLLKAECTDAVATLRSRLESINAQRN